ncbi:MAG: flagellar protein G [Methanosarcinaceae archaeon]|nr:flagellar protein G [Methanosarcinaceae archaeon]MDF1533032.1 flagellar protein G [Methanosarcinaceae archaeon]
MLFSRTIFKDERAETAITHMIFFIAAVVLAMGVVAVLSTNVQSISGATTAGSKVMSDQLRTDITIINDPNEVPYINNENYTFYVKNTGRSELNIDYVNIILDGVLIQSNNQDITVLDGDVVWRPGDVLGINVTISQLSSGDHSVRVVSENGKSDAMNFITP